MTDLAGGDSYGPEPEFYAHHDVWCCYVGGPSIGFVWTRPEVAAMQQWGINRVLPIVGPPESWPWSPGEAAGLAGAARSWGVPEACALVLDVEEELAEEMSQADIVALDESWFHAWSGESVIYAPQSFLQYVTKCSKFLAMWPDSAPPHPTVPLGDVGWQYEGNAEGGAIDQDVFLSSLTYMTPDGGVIAPPHTTPTPPTPPEEDTVATPDPNYLAKGTGYWAVVDGGLKSKSIIADEATGVALGAAGYKTLDITAADVDMLPTVSKS